MAPLKPANHTAAIGTDPARWVKSGWKAIRNETKVTVDLQPHSAILYKCFIASESSMRHPI